MMAKLIPFNEAVPLAHFLSVYKNELNEFIEKRNKLESIIDRIGDTELTHAAIEYFDMNDIQMRTIGVEIYESLTHHLGN